MAANYKTVLEAGDDAPWLVMVHGMTQDHRVFSAQVAAFKDRYRILLVDLPGHGLSADIPGPFGHRELAAHVAGAIDDAGVARCHYWATHTGTSLGLLLAVDKPDRFHCLILEGVVLPGHPMASVDATIGQARTVARAEGMAEALRRWFDDGAWFAAMHRHPEACRADAHRAIVNDFSGAPWFHEGPAAAVAPVDDRLAGLALPVLLFNGEHDVPDFIAAADHLEKLLSHAQRATIPDAAGFAGWEYPDRVNVLVADFLASQAGGTNKD